MKEVLWEYVEQQNSIYEVISSDLIEALSWSGLRRTTLWGELAQDDKDQIIETINNLNQTYPNCD